MKKILAILLFVLLLIIIGVIWVFSLKEKEQPVVVNTVTNFDECVAAGNPVLESYPRRCQTTEQSFAEDVGNELEKTDLIRIDYPRPNQSVASPLKIIGQARGNWFFEASFPVVLTDWDGKIIAEGIATAEGDWMTTEFVPFSASLVFTADANAYSNRGFLIFKKDNPSGLPQNDDALEIPVILGVPSVNIIDNNVSPLACTMDAKICPDGSYVGRTGPKCEFAPCPNPDEVKETEQTVKFNETIVMGEMSITATEILSDSRCPVDVTCVWAGEIVVEVKLEKDGVEETVEMKEGESVTTQDNKITLVSVLPLKESETEVEKGDYQFVFRVE